MQNQRLRLALYSDQERVANQLMDERLMQLIGIKHPKIGYIASAPDPDRIYFEIKRVYYERLGVELSHYVDSESPKACFDALFECDAIHLSGGNTFEFSRWLQHAELLVPLSHYAVERGVLIGVSAGAILMTSSIGTASLCGDIADRPVSEYLGMGLVQFGFWPHYASTNDQKSVSRLEGVSEVLYACPDGTGLIVDGASLETYGPISILRGGR